MSDKKHKLTDDKNSILGLKYMAFMGIDIPNPIPIPLGVKGLEKYENSLENDNLVVDLITKNSNFDFLPLATNNPIEQAANDIKRSGYFDVIKQELLLALNSLPVNEETIQKALSMTPEEQENQVNSIRKSGQHSIN